MSVLKWDEDGQRLYETGVSNGVLFPYGDDGYETGVAWNGLISVAENPSGGDISDLYADNTKYLSLVAAENYGATIEAYTYPEEFADCNGETELAQGVYITQQTRKSFGFSYKTLIGNDTEGTDKGYKLHLVYGCKAKPSSKDYNTVNESPEAITFSWEISTVPAAVTGEKPTAHIIIDSTKVNAGKLATFLDMLYGKDGDGSTGKEPTLPLPDAVKAHFAS